MSNRILDAGASVAHRHGIPRSGRWPHVRDEHLRREPTCACCDGGATGLAVQVHHIIPFHYCVALGRADLELDDRNLITLCESTHEKPGPNHHLLVGHLASFESANLVARHDAEHRFHGMAADAIKADAAWVAEVAARLKPLAALTDDDKAELLRLMNVRFPEISR